MWHNNLVLDLRQLNIAGENSPPPRGLPNDKVLCWHGGVRTGTLLMQVNTMNTTSMHRLYKTLKAITLIGRIKVIEGYTHPHPHTPQHTTSLTYPPTPTPTLMHTKKNLNLPSVPQFWYYLGSYSLYPLSFTCLSLWGDYTTAYSYFGLN